VGKESEAAASAGVQGYTTGKESEAAASGPMLEGLFQEPGNEGDDEEEMEADEEELTEEHVTRRRQRREDALEEQQRRRARCNHTGGMTVPEDVAGGRSRAASLPAPAAGAGNGAGHKVHVVRESTGAAAARGGTNARGTDENEGSGYMRPNPKPSKT